MTQFSWAWQGYPHGGSGRACEAWRGTAGHGQAWPGTVRYGAAWLPWARLGQS